MTWHMQQEDRVKMITGCSVMRRWILVSADSSISMDKEEEEFEFMDMVVVVVVVAVVVAKSS
jgi:hypothetical protein